MTAFFWMLADAAFAAGWAVLLLLWWRWLFGKRTPRWIAVAMWAVVALRLVCPFSIESEMSMMPQPLSQTVATMQGETVTAPTAVAPLPEQEPVTSPVKNSPSVPWETVACGVWFCGMVGMFGYAVVSYARMKRAVQMATKREQGVYECETVASPFILGVVAPRIYLPYCMTDDDRAHALAHERAHIARGDHLLKPFAFLLLSVYWFHPLLWLAYILFCRDIEFACDEKVIKMLSLEERKSYSRALLCASVDRRRVVMCPLAFGEVGVEARVKGIAKYKKPVIVTVVIAAIGCGLVGWWMVTDPPAPARTTLEDAYLYVNYEDKGVSDLEKLLVEEGNRLSLHTASGKPLQMEIEHIDTEDMRVSVRFSQSGKQGRRIDVHIDGYTTTDTGNDGGKVTLKLQLPTAQKTEQPEEGFETVYGTDGMMLRLYDAYYCLSFDSSDSIYGTYEKTDDTLTLTQDAHLTEYVLTADGNGGWQFDAEASYRHKKAGSPAIADGTVFSFFYRYTYEKVNQHYRFSVFNVQDQRVYASYSAFDVMPAFALQEDGYLQITTNAPAANPKEQTIWVHMTTGDLLPKHGGWG